MLTPDEFMERVLELLAQERRDPMRWWYLSYATEEGFLGAVYIEAHGPVEAAFFSNKRKISPGGEVFMAQVPNGKLPEERFRNRLLTRDEVIAANPSEDVKTIAEFEAEEKENDATKHQ
jgi:hypothetical protein